MKKNCILTVLSLFAGLFSASAQPYFRWAAAIRETGIAQYAEDLVADDNGNVYVIGNFLTNLELDGSGSGVVKIQSVPTYNSTYVAKYNKDGKLEWSDVISSPTVTSKAGGITIGADGRIYAAGYFGANLGSNMVSFVAKYEPNGTKIWQKTFGNGAVAIKEIKKYGNDLIVGANYIITSGLDISPAPGLQTVTGGGSDNTQCTFLAKYDTAFNVIWSQYYAYQGDFKRVYINPVDNIPYTIQAWGSGFPNLEVAKANPNSGAKLSAGTISNGMNNQSIPALAFDNDGNIILGFSTNVTVDVDPSANSVNVAPVGTAYNTILVKFDDGLVYLNHYKTSSSESSILRDLKIVNNKIYIGGYISGTPTLSFTGGGTPLPSYGSFDCFISTYNLSNLALETVNTFGGNQLETVNRIWVENDNTINMIGTYTNSNIDMDFTSGTFNLDAPLIGADDNFLAKWSPSCETNIAYQPVASASCLNSVVNLSFGVTGSGKTYNWYHNNALVHTANNPFYSFTLSSSTLGTYYCVVTNNCGPDVQSQVVDLTSPFSVNNAALNQGLLVYLPFNGNINDASPFNRTVTAQGNPTYATDRLGRSQGAINFDGIDDYLQLPPDVYFGNTSSFSLSAWVYLRGNSNPINYGRIFDFANGAPDNNVAWLSGFNNNQKENLVVINGTSPTDRVESGAAALTLNTWTHLAVVYENGTAYLYRNGALVASGSMPNPNNVVRNFCYIGKSNWTNDPLSYMRLDEFRIYNRALNATEINALLNFIEFTTQPTGVSTCNSNNPIQLAAVLSGNVDMLDWYKDGNPLGINNDTLNIASPTLADNGAYVLKAINSCYMAESNPAIVNQVTTGPTINSLSDDSISVCQGSSFTISVNASNASMYSWFNRAEQIIGEGSTVQINTSQLNSQGDTIFVMVKNACGFASSSIVPVSIISAPSVGSVNSFYVCEGSPINLTVPISNASSVVWIRNSTPFSPTTDSTLVVSNANQNYTGTYTITASNSCGNNTIQFNLLVKSIVSYNIQPYSNNYVSNDTIFQCNNQPTIVNLNTSNLASYIAYRNTGNGFNQFNQCNSICNNLWNNAGSPGQYYLALTSFEGCTINTDTFVIANKAFLTTGTATSITPSNTCEGSNIEITTTGYTANTPLIYEYKINYLGNTETTISGPNPNLNYTPVHSTGYYSVNLTITDGCNGDIVNFNYNINQNQTYTLSIAPTTMDYCVNSQASIPCIELNLSNNININNLQYSFSGFNTTPSGPFVCSNQSSVSFMTSNESGKIYVSFNTNGLCANPNSVVLDSIEVIARDLPTPVIADNFGTLEVLNGPYTTYTWVEANNQSAVLSNNATYTPTVSGNYGVTVTNQYGCSQFNGWYNFIYTGLDKLNTTVGVRAFPNPFNGQLTIELGKEVNSIEILDATGKLVNKLTSIQLGTNTIDTYDLSYGLYLVKVTDTNGKEQLLKITKQ